MLNSLSDPDLMQRFETAASLPAGYGVGIDERCVEYPWVFSRLRGVGSSVLDAGGACDHEFLLDAPELATRTLDVATLAPEGAALPGRGVSYLFADLRDLPLRDERYDCVVCISTLEHVGFDNSAYSGSRAHVEHTPSSFQEAVAEFARVLKPSGTLLLTVPFGAREQFSTFQQFDSERLAAAIAAFGETASVERTFYRYTPRGWDVAGEAECSNSRFAAWIMLPPDQRSEAPSAESDRAAAARAVACIKLIKAQAGP